MCTAIKTVGQMDWVLINKKDVQGYNFLKPLRMFA